MTISNTVRKAGPYSGNGITTAFPFSFKVFAAADVLVVLTNTSTGVETTQTLTSQYTVALNPNQDSNPGGTVTMIAAPAAGFTLTIGSQITYSQPMVLTNTGGFYPTVINDALDRATALIQQLLERSARALSLPFSAASGVSTSLPAPVANNLIAWDGTGSGFQNVNPAGIVSIATYGSTVADLFSGTGVQTAFTLSGNPAVIANLDVSVGGVVQRPGIDYTWSGTTLTFTTPPAAGTNNILVRYGTTVPAGTATSATTATNLAGGVTGQIPYQSGAGTTAFVGPGTAGQVLLSQGAGQPPVYGTPQGANLQEFSSSGTWTKPSGATFVMVELWGGGAGGSGGANSANSGDGGGGGGGGQKTFAMFRAADLPSTVSVTLGAGGTGGTGTTAGAANIGTTGGNTTFGAFLTARGGAIAGGDHRFGGGGGGFPATYTNGGRSVIGGQGASEAGQVSSGGSAEYGGGSGSGGGGGVNGGSSVYGGGGGSGGGGTNTNSTGSGGGTGVYQTGGGAAGVTTGQNGNNGTQSSLGNGSGGSGGGGANSGAGGNGGNGGPGGGGGGGGGRGAGATGGNGGNGGAGYARIYSW